MSVFNSSDLETAKPHDLYVLSTVYRNMAQTLAFFTHTHVENIHREPPDKWAQIVASDLSQCIQVLHDINAEAAKRSPADGREMAELDAIRYMLEAEGYNDIIEKP